MAAYGALVSLMYIIEQIEHHPRPPISLDGQQVQSLVGNVAFLMEFLESGYNSHVGYSTEADPLEKSIADAAYKAEYMIESHIADQLLAESTSQGEKFTAADLYRFLEEVIESMDSIKTEVKQIKETMGMEYQMQKNLSISSASLRSPHSRKNIATVGFDEVFNQVIDMLMGPQSNLKIIPISGMVGIGKTTLAREIYDSQYITEYFHDRAWVTVSQEYSVREILLKLLSCLEKGTYSQWDEVKLGVQLHKNLYRQRYLIVMDDVWSIKVWDGVRKYIPDDNIGSRIMITTRLSNLAVQLSGSQSCGFIEMEFLDENESWDLLCQTVFGKESCPIELKEIGKQIARSCEGLPLSIVVIGGLLAKSKRTCEYWGYVAENLNLIVNSEGDGRCLQILYMSYRQLPVHLKPCFLFMGVFPEDMSVVASVLIDLWVAEGFIKSIYGKTLEDVAEVNLMELIDRNMILSGELGFSWKVKSCHVHDLVRDLCLREAKKQNFLGLLKRQQRPKDRVIPRGIHLQGLELEKKSHFHLEDEFARSFIWLIPKALEEVSFDDQVRKNKHFQERVLKLFYLRYLSNPQMGQGVPSSIFYRFWNLHSLVFGCTSATAPPEIWKMALLRRVAFTEINLPDPPTKDDFVLGNLQTLFTIKVWNLRKEVVDRIPNTKKLKICLGEFEGWSVHFLSNLSHLQKLESLYCFFFDKGIRSGLLHNLVFPHSLKKLILYGSNLQWDDMTTMIGSLPFLQVLKLKRQSFNGPEWETVEDQFRSLKFLQIESCDLKYWKTDSTHFPRLERLRLGGLVELTEIPSDIGHIPTLQSIEVVHCSYSSGASAGIIQREQEDYGNTRLVVAVVVNNMYAYAREFGSLAGQKVEFEIGDEDSLDDSFCSEWNECCEQTIWHMHGCV